MPEVAEAAALPVLQFHLEPDEPIEVAELTAALAAVASQYQSFSALEGFAQEGNARLFVSSVTPGSIDINFLPDIVAMGAVVAPLIDGYEPVAKFAESIKSLLDVFSANREHDIPATISVRDCNDAINITSPIAQHER